jgi:hypothetical protein
LSNAPSSGALRGRPDVRTTQLSDQDAAQLITVVILAFVVPVLVIILLVKFVTGEKSAAPAPRR